MPHPSGDGGAPWLPPVPTSALRHRPVRHDLPGAGRPEEEEGRLQVLLQETKIGQFSKFYAPNNTVPKLESYIFELSWLSIQRTHSYR